MRLLYGRLSTLQFLMLILVGPALGQPPDSNDSTEDDVFPTPVTVEQEFKQDPQTNAERHFQFSYGATIEDVPERAMIKIWFPVAPNNAQQTIEILKTTSPAKLQFNDEPKFGNRIGFFELTQDNTDANSFRVVYDVVRKESDVDSTQVKLESDRQRQFLAADSLVPITGKPLELLKNQKLSDSPSLAGRQLYELVDAHMTYDKSKPGYGNGDSAWACDSRTGNCTDFHSLFISLARSRAIPARFEIGFPLPPNQKSGVVNGYHCWAWFFVAGSGWKPVDISEADKHPEMKEYYFGKLTQDRVAFSSGRDIALIPESKSGPLNYFIYPHVEVDGVVWPKEKITLDFSFKDIE